MAVDAGCGGGLPPGHTTYGIAGHKGLGEDEELDVLGSGLLDETDSFLESRGLVHEDRGRMGRGDLELGLLAGGHGGGMGFASRWDGGMTKCRPRFGCAVEKKTKRRRGSGPPRGWSQRIFPRIWVLAAAFWNHSAIDIAIPQPADILTSLGHLGVRRKS
jgi:hypothetical protein